jgi:hypothetical protein
MRRLFVQARVEWRQLCEYDYGGEIVNATDMMFHATRTAFGYGDARHGILLVIFRD